MANSTGSYGVFFVDLVDGAVAVVGVVSTIKNWSNILRNDALTIINRWTTTYKNDLAKNTNILACTLLIIILIMSIITFKTHICNCIAEFKNKSCFVLSKNVFAITNIGITKTEHSWFWPMTRTMAYTLNGLNERSQHNLVACPSSYSQAPLV